MTSRRAFFAAMAAGLPAAAQRQRFPMPPGLQLYSVRRLMAKDVPGTLKLVREMGFKELEAGSFYGLPGKEFLRLLDENGLRVVAYGAEWNRMSKSTSEPADEARLLGARYIDCSAIPRKAKRQTLEEIERAAENFNRWGEEFSRAGLSFCYHPHGPEFIEGPDGTLFDTLAKRTDPKFVKFEMDVFWFLFGNTDPAKMLEKYSGRFPLMHVKDMRKGEPRTYDPGPVREEASVPLGTGEVDWPPVFRAALKTGVKHYFIEEEHPNAVAQIKQTLVYLENLRF